LDERIYLTKLINAAGYQNYVSSPIRGGDRAAFLYQQSVTTSQVYNNYPDDHGPGRVSTSSTATGGEYHVGTTRAREKCHFGPAYSGFGTDSS